MRIGNQKLICGQPVTKLCAALLMLALINGATVIAYGQGKQNTDSRKKSVSSTTDDLAAQHYNRARNLIAVNNWAAAEEKLDYVIARYSNSKYLEPSLYWLAYACKQQGKYQKAVLLLNRLINEFPRSVWVNDARTLRAELAARVGDTKIINESLESANDDETKLAALSSLFQINPEEGLRRAIEILDSAAAGNVNLREAIIVLIGKYAGGEETSAVLLNIARTERETVTRTAAVIGLKKRLTESVLAQLVELVIKCDDNTVAETALFVIAQQDNEQAKKALVQIVLSAESPDTRKHAVHFLGKLKSGDVIDELIRLSDSVQEIEVKREVLFTLMQTGNRAAQSKAFEIYRRADDVGIREEGIVLSAQYGNVEIIEKIIQIYDGETSEEMKLLILVSLGKSKQKNALRKLASVAENEKSPALRKKAAQLLKQKAESEVPKK